MNAEEIEEVARQTLGDAPLNEAAATSAEAPAESYATTYTDADGTVYDWDFQRQGWFPRIDEDFLARYQANYGSHPLSTTAAAPAPQPIPAAANEGTAAAGSANGNPEAANGETASATSSNAESVDQINASRKRVHQVQTEWFELDATKNPNVYIQGLPSDITMETLAEFMRKCGIIKEDDKGRPRLKIYRDDEGVPKGDGLCTYLKVESVGLALDILDGEEISPGHKIKLQRAKFEQKGDFKPQKKLRKKQKSKQEKLLEWTDKKETGLVSKKVASIVILKNLFEPSEFDDDPMGITEISDDVRAECSKCGPVSKVIVYDRHQEGIVSVKFGDVEAAEKCVKLMNGRFFGGKRITAERWDGKTSYKIEETDHEREERLAKWEKYLEGTKQKVPVPVGQAPGPADTDSAEVVEDL